MKTIRTMATAALLLLACQALEAGELRGHDRIRAWIAESMEWRLSYLPVVYQDFDAIDVATGASEGAAWLKRTRNGLKGRVMTNVATAGEPYTVWWVVFNNPGACEEPFLCNPETDPLNPDTESSAYYGNGAVSTSNGNGGGAINVDVETVAGDLPEGMFFLFGDKPGLHRGNGFGAEVWLIVDLHPHPGTESWVPDLTSTNFPGMGPATTHRVSIFRAVE